MTGAIYTIGSEGLKYERLERIVMSLDLLVVDVRAADVAAKGECARSILANSEFGGWYEYRHNLTSGECDERAIESIRGLTERYSVLLLGVAEAPSACHRHTIALKLLPELDCIHIYGDELIRASELERSMRDGDDYECFEIPDDLK